MLFDLRVILAACLATVLFAAVGFGLIAALRSPLKVSAGYPDGPAFAGPGLPRGQPIFAPAPTPAQPEVTGTVANAPDPKPAPQAAAKNPIASLIEDEDKKKAAEKEKAAKQKAARRRAQQQLHAKALKQQQQQKANPWTAFTTNNSATANRTGTTTAQ